jgi:malonyl-CoA O-methyltransferase
MSEVFSIDRQMTRRNFENSANTYDAAAILQQEVARRLLERLDYIKIQPQLAVDLGCGTGQITEALLKQYPKTQVIALDLAINMLAKARKKGSWLRKPMAVCADVNQLPLQSHHVDLIISSLMLQWCDDLPKVFADIARTMKTGGLVLFTTFGPDTLKELRQSWAKVDNLPHSSQYLDMHDIGDQLMQAGFSQPVMDMEMITMTYSKVEYLMRDLKQIGANNTDSRRRKTLTGKQRMQAFIQAYEHFKQADGLYPASYEVIYGHAWIPDLSVKKPAGVETFIPIKAI